MLKSNLDLSLYIAFVTKELLSYLIRSDAMHFLHLFFNTRQVYFNCSSILSIQFCSKL